MAPVCKIEGCGKPAIARQLCQAHYAKWKKYRDPLMVKAVPAKTECSVPGCIPKGPIKAGLCNKHYMRLKTTGSTELSRKTERGKPAAFVDAVIKGEVAAPDGQCLIWPFGRAHGYAIIGVRGRSRKVHQVVCEALHGPSGPGQECRHLCGNGARGGVTPAHLRWGTHAENMADLSEHGGGNWPLGEAQWMAKLTADDVRAIRAAAASGGTQQSIANRYGVNQPHVSAIVRRKKWAWLE